MLPERVEENWGFGMAPPKRATQEERTAACSAVLSLLVEQHPQVATKLLDDLSTVKGLFNRIARQDQWDWFTVAAQLGYPSARCYGAAARKLHPSSPM